VCRQIEMGCFKILQYLKLYHLNLTVLIFCLPLYYQVVKLSLKGHDLSGKFVCFLFTVHNETCSLTLPAVMTELCIIEIILSSRYSDQNVGNFCIFCILYATYFHTPTY